MSREKQRQQAMRRVVDAMHAAVESGQQLTVARAARVALYSQFHFARLFRREFGMPPGQYLSDLRYEHARQLLLTTSLPVTEVAERSGFRSPGTFATSFGRRFGNPPGLYRRQQRNGGAS